MRTYSSLDNSCRWQLRPTLFSHARAAAKATALRTSSVQSAKRTLSRIGCSRSYKVILIALLPAEIQNDLISQTYEDQRQTASDRYEDSGFELSQNIVNFRANVVHTTSRFVDWLLTPLLFHLNFGGVPVAPRRACWGQPELFGREIIFEVFQPVWKHTWTSQTDRQTTYCSITALCVASCGKNCNHFI